MKNKKIIFLIILSTIISSLITSIGIEVIKDHKWHTFNIDKRQYDIVNYSYNKDNHTISIVLKDK